MITARFLLKTVCVLLDNRWDHRPIGRYPGTVLYGRWWLRSPGDSQDSAAFVDFGGPFVDRLVDRDDVCVRPALWVDIELLPQ